MVGNLVSTKGEKKLRNFDVVIIGSGVIGLSIAYHLSQFPDLKVAVIEKEKLPCTGSTANCTGGIRHQFSNPTNIALTKISLPYLMNFEKEMDYPVYAMNRGYLFVSSDPSKVTDFESVLAMLKKFGVSADFLTPADIAQQYPYLQTDDLVGGTICPLDACADPYGVTMGYFKQSRNNGVEVFFQEEVTGMIVSDHQVKGIQTTAGSISCKVLVNAAGPHLPEIGKMAGLDIPARPYRRQVYVCSPLSDIPADAPLVVDMDTGFYLHTERSGTLLLGGTDKDSSPGRDTSVDWSLLDGFIEAAVHRIPCLEEADLVRAYVGTRSLTPDYMGIVGEHPHLKGFYLAGGFAGNGFMHSPAIGLITSQLITKGRCDLLDISPLSPARLCGEKEKNIF